MSDLACLWPFLLPPPPVVPGFACHVMVKKSGIKEFVDAGAMLGQLWMEGHFEVGDPLINSGAEKRPIGGGNLRQTDSCTLKYSLKNHRLRRF